MSKPRLGDRSLFPRLEPWAYLNHAAISPPSLPVHAAVEDSLAGYSRRGVGQFPLESERRGELRAALATLLGCEANDLALTSNTSAGVIAVASCVPWRVGDRVILFRGEFPTNVTPWQRAAERHGLELCWLDADAFRHSPAVALQQLEHEIAKGARMVAVSAVQFQTGFAMPLAKIGALCAQTGHTELFVDAIQGLGVLPLDVATIGAHYVSAGGHKWLMGPEGTGVLYARRESVERWRPELASWLSHEEGLKFLFEGSGHLRYDRAIRREVQWLERGASNALGAAGLHASVSLLLELGVPTIFEHVQRWHDRVEPALVERGWQSARATEAPGRSGILSLRPPTPCDVLALSQAAGELGVSLACPDGWIRLAPHWPNHLDECERVVEVLVEAHERVAP